jgi:hypothetical protein
MQRPASQPTVDICYAQAPYISAFMARQDFDRLFGARSQIMRAAITDNRQIPFIYTLAAMTVYCSIFWVAVFKIIF